MEKIKIGDVVVLNNQGISVMNNSLNKVTIPKFRNPCKVIGTYDEPRAKSDNKTIAKLDNGLEIHTDYLEVHKPMELNANEKRVMLHDFFRWYPYLQNLENGSIVEAKLNDSENAFTLILSNGIKLNRLRVSKGMITSENYILRYINTICK